DRHVAELFASGENALAEKVLRADGLAIVDADTLLPLYVDSQRAVILMAAWLVKARLIDNHQVDLTH
ncbi:pantoate--beta-alanine ligase, partial [Erwinia amylovora]|uniref:pantoate--beta-alanine ligase n=1 Tax=Erwinia amylovora TaxID=552 RepID=UPI002009DD9F